MPAPQPITAFGRERELGVIDAARTGRADAVVAVTGEPGIGKTTLADAAAQRAEADGWRVARGRAVGLDAPPGWPWPSLLEQLGVPEPPGSPGRFDRFRHAARALEAAAARHPLLLVLDDLHEADEDTLLLCRFVASELRHSAVVQLLTWRDVEARPDDRRLALLAALAAAGRTVALGPLPPEVIAALVERRAARARAARPAVDAQTVARLSGGNPLLAQHVIDAGDGLLSGPLPATTMGILAERFRPLGQKTRRVLAEAAELGGNPSVAELAMASQRDLEEIEHAFAEGEAERLVMRDAAGEWSFSHELVRLALAQDLAPVERRRLHGRVLARLAGSAHARHDLSARVARHAVEAADPTDPRAIGVAVTWCRRAAQAALARGDAPRASELLDRAVLLVSVVPEGGPRAALLTERAEASLARGRLSDAHEQFATACLAAEHEDDDESLARAALGRGGVWLGQVRDRIEYLQLQALREEAWHRAQDRWPLLAAGLAMRRAAEDAYLSGDITSVQRALADVRSFGDPAALAEALSLYHHLLMRPDATGSRLEVAHELRDQAAAARNEFLSLMSLCWIAVDLACAGAPETDNAVVAFAGRADALQMEALQYIADVMRTMLAIRDGRLAEAETMAERAFALGLRVGDNDALAYYGAQLMTIRWMQGRGAELLPLMRSVLESPSTGNLNPALVAGHALLLAEAGELDEARHEISTLLPLDRMTPYSGSLITLFCIVEVAAILGDGALAMAAVEHLRGYEHLPMRPSLAVTCIGSTARAFALAHLAAGQPHRAVEHLRAAVDHNVALGNLPMVAITRAELAALAQAQGNATEAEELWSLAIQAGEALGLDRRVLAWRAARDRRPESEPARLARRGSRWQLVHSGLVLELPGLVGLSYLAALVAAPATEIEAWRLVAPTASAVEPLHQPVLDAQSIAQLRRRADSLRRELDLADQRGDAVASREHSNELQGILDELRRSRARSGRARNFAGNDDRARSAVTKAIARAIDHIESLDASLGDSLRRAVRTGTRCAFDPHAALPWRWAVEATDAGDR